MLNFLARLLGAAPNDTLEGLRLDMSSGYWEADGETDVSRFFRAIPLIAGHGAYLYLEGGAPDGELGAWIRSRCVAAPVQIARGNIWPRTDPFHIPVTVQNLEELAQLAESAAFPELASHCHVYCPAKMILQWHDAFDAPMLLDVGLSERVVADFTRTIGFAYDARLSEG